MGVVGSPLQSIDADNLSKLNPQPVFLEPQENVPAKEVAGKHIVFKPVPAHPSGPLGVVVVHAVQKMGSP